MGIGTPSSNNKIDRMSPSQISVYKCGAGIVSRRRPPIVAA